MLPELSRTIGQPSKEALAPHPMGPRHPAHSGIQARKGGDVETVGPGPKGVRTISTFQFKAPLQDDSILPPTQAARTSESSATTPLNFAPLCLHTCYCNSLCPPPCPFSQPGKLLPITHPSKPNSKHLLWEVLLTSGETY